MYKDFFKRNIKINFYLILGIVIGLLYLPFLTIPSVIEGYFTKNYIVYSKYLYLFSLIFSGFGTVISLKLDHMHFLFRKRIISFYFIGLPLSIILFQITFLSKMTNIFHMEYFSFLLMIAILFWYLVAGMLLAIYLKSSENALKSWSDHLIGLFIGYAIGYLYLQYYGLFAIIFFAFSLLIIIEFAFLRNWLFISLIALILFFVNLYERKLDLIYAKQINQLQGIQNFSDAKTSKKMAIINSSDDDIEYAIWGLRGLTIIRKKMEKTTVMVNGYHHFQQSLNDVRLSRRISMYQKLLASVKGKVVIVGVGGLRSLLNVSTDLMTNISGIEINKSIVDYFKKNPQTKALSKQINYINQDGRFFIDTATNDSLDLIIYESSFHFAQSLTNEYLRPVHLITEEAMEMAFNKLNHRGVLIYETSNRYNLGKTYLLGKVIDFIKDHNFNYFMLTSQNSDRLFLISSKNAEVVNNMKALLADDMQDLFDDSQLVNIVNGCKGKLTDNFAFIPVQCNPEMGELFNKLYIGFSLIVLFILVYILIKLMKNRFNVENIMMMFFIGFFQVLWFTFVQYKTYSYLYDDYFTTHFLILLNIISSLIYINYLRSYSFLFKYSLIATVFTIAILILFNIYLVENIFFRFVVLTVTSFSGFILGSLLFTIYYNKIQDRTLVKGLWLDSLGMFFGLVVSYLLLREWGVSAIGICTLFFLFFLIVKNIRNLKYL